MTRKRCAELSGIAVAIIWMCGASRGCFAQPWSTKANDQLAEYVVSILEDSQGRLWFGTMSRGVAMYDGQRLTYFNKQAGLIGNSVASIAEDQKGNLWFGTHSGVSKYDGRGFVNFAENQGLHGAGCELLVTNKGAIWVGTNHGAFRLRGTQFEEFELPRPRVGKTTYKWELGKVWALIEDQQGAIWFGRDGYGACRYDGKSFVHLTTDEGLQSNNVSQIVQDSSGSIWFGCLTSDQPMPVRQGGLSRFDGRECIGFPGQRGLTQNDIYALGLDRSRDLWIAATGVGAYRFDGKSFELFSRTDRPDLTEQFGLQAILEDRRGRMWLGFSGGLFRFVDGNIVNVTKRGPWE